MLALALQGIGGMNSFSGGVLHTFRQNNLTPDLISATSGAILSAYYFLQSDKDALLKFYREYFESNQDGVPDVLKFYSHTMLGLPGVFRPIYPLERLAEAKQLLSSKDWLNFLFPNKLYKPTRPYSFFEDVAELFQASSTGVIINAYNYDLDKAVLYVNKAALEKTDLVLGNGKRYIVRELTPEGVISSLQLLQYGDYRGEYDGAYQFNPVVHPLTVAEKIVLVAVEPIGKSLKPMENYFDVEDFKLKMMFKNAIYAELNSIDLINKLIRGQLLSHEKYKEITVDIIQPSLFRGYFDYFQEEPDFFHDGVKQAEAFFAEKVEHQK